jgi:hypothetical protein
MVVLFQEISWMHILPHLIAEYNFYYYYYFYITFIIEYYLL